MSDQPTVCPACGQPLAQRKRRDYYLSLFFIPLIPVKRGKEFLECEACGVNPRPWPGNGPETSRRAAGPRLCTRCDRELEPRFDFCPYCGQRNA